MDVVLTIIRLYKDPRAIVPQRSNLTCDPSLAKEKLGWPSTTLEELVNEMILEDSHEAKKIRAITNQGFKYVASQERI